MKKRRGNDWLRGIANLSPQSVAKVCEGGRARIHKLRDDIQLRRRLKISEREPGTHPAWVWVRHHRGRLIKSATAVTLVAAVTVGGNLYIKSNMNEIYHVYVGDKEAGAVTDPSVVRAFLAQRTEELKKQYPNVHMVLKTEGIHYISEKAFMGQGDDAAVTAKLDDLIPTAALGTKLIIDGKTVAIVKDQQTADQILNAIKNKYVPHPDPAGKVGILSASQGGTVDGKLDSVQFVQDVDTETVPIEPGDLVEPADVIKKLETGGIKPKTYVVQDGDTISGIAQKFGITQQQIYDKNAWIVDDVIHPGDEIDVTVFEPALSVRTTELVSEDQEIQFSTDYTKDPTMRAGEIRITSPGKNGLKKVTYKLTKINGQLIREELQNEETIIPPETQKAIKGTKVVLGQGTGNFRWPVVRAILTSSFGKRWGEFHKGVDLASSNRAILAADNGKVVFAGWKNGYGNCIILDHQNGYQTLYGHMKSLLVKKGDTVEKGDQIGVMGSTGDSTGVHLHFEVHVNGTVENPLKYLP